MKTIFDKETREKLIARISKLDKNSLAQFGKMNIYQMIKHCTLYDEWILGKNKPQYQQALIGRLFGKMALKDILKDESPLKRNVPTLSFLKVIKTTDDLEAEKSKWISLIEEYDYFSNPEFIHSFFGKMTKEQIGYMAYKHIDHHLRQFGA
ncbi:DUF1569 domain-containing protein [Kaistella flava (ex Peng et al. 2021)]|uniref:DUF1569 domain-containing protein n=1 Tax=Kaistella flava (ex Peng et al. 2021) TaxID=2038776 RepID=A0A7M2Y602_9FLAO|nr:DUF1569 domain-containing protein [Kaistella flava (ex Peng et al. 2021)]QOW09591.1 DUF1569 domain-containing protein [Kaistella flava (ex Peng et al. 2021)]